MKDILNVRHQARLKRFLTANALLVFDYDGTLAPIALRPSQANLPEKTARLLIQLCERRACALLTGRSRTDMRTKLSGVPFCDVVGNHGAEWAKPWRGFAKERKLTAQWLRTLRRELAGIPGLAIETKGISLSVHWRRVEHQRRYLPRITERVLACEGSRLVAGKQVFNVVPQTLPHKGDGVRRLMQRHRATHALYLGDDHTDEDVFRLRDPKILGIHVGGRIESVAEFLLPRQSQINRFLRVLLDFSEQN